MKNIGGRWLPTVTDTAIYGFFGEYRFLSNFHRGQVEVDGLVYPSSEHAYMAQKSLNLDVKQSFTSQTLTCSAARKKGQEIELRPDWDEVKIDAMRRVVYAKFSQDPELKQKLLDTGDKYLEETNYWNDRFWGVCRGSGQNQLGLALMATRTRLRSEE